MDPIRAVFLLALAAKTSSAAPSVGPEEGPGQKPVEVCCDTKTVGAYNYTKVSTGKVPTECLNNCIYTRDDQPGSRYCFARGEQEVHCLSDNIKGTTSCKCGVKKANRIVGGSNATMNEYIWIGSVASPDGTIPSCPGCQCGSTLIASNWLVTAAHCVEGDTPSDITVVLGLHDRLSTSEPLRKVLTISEIIRHPSWGNPNSDISADIALLKTTEPVDLTTYSPACLPDPRTDFAEQKGWVAGWGITEDGSSARWLRELEVPIVSDAVCNATSLTITPDELCAGGKMGEDSCTGDSGGPLTVEVDGRHTLVGVVNRGPPNCGMEPSQPYGVYAEVPYFRDWIDEIINANGDATICTG